MSAELLNVAQPISTSGVLNSATELPPLVYSQPAAGLPERLLRWGLVVLFHAGLLFLLWQVAGKPDVQALIPTISVRLLPVETAIKPPQPVPPKSVQQPRRVEAQRPPPVLTAKSESGTDAFVVAPQPPAVPVAPVVTTPAPVPATVAARFDADYLHNPKPVYPVLSRRNGEEGRVVLRVRVAPDGSALEALVGKSSGFLRLDALARETVSRWRFVPARRGDEAVESWVSVPITFSLE